MTGGKIPPSAAGGGEKADGDLSAGQKTAVPLEISATTRLLHELQAHRDELEVQKAELQDALELLLEDYKVLYDFAPVGYLSLDCNGCILKTNLAMNTILGVAKSQIVNRSFTQFVADEDRLRFFSFLKRVFSKRTHKSTCELKLVGKEQLTTIVQIEAQSIKSGQLCLAAVTDVTDLRLEEQKFHIMADHTYAWEFWLGPDGAFVYVSPSCRHITGYDVAEFTSDPTLFYRIIHHEDRDYTFCNCSSDSPSAKINFEYRIIHKNGSVRWIRHDGQLVTAPDGTNLGLRGSNLDVTAERHLKRQLVRSLDELKKLAAELNLSEERERRRIALTLHDQVVQSLAIGNLSLDAALQKGDIVNHPVLQELKCILESSIRDLRDLSLDLSSPLLYDVGLSAAISNLGQKLEKKFGFQFVFLSDWTSDTTLSEDLAVSAYQFCRELLINAGKHAAAATVTAFLGLADDHLVLKIYDNGNGFDTADCTEGFGITNIRQRVNYLKGNFKLHSIIGSGTSAEISIRMRSTHFTTGEQLYDN
jgi:PAS domain S-box-containing protein